MPGALAPLFRGTQSPVNVGVCNDDEEHNSKCGYQAGTGTGLRMKTGLDSSSTMSLGPKGRVQARCCLDRRFLRALRQGTGRNIPAYVIFIYRL